MIDDDTTMVAAAPGTMLEVRHQANHHSDVMWSVTTLRRRVVAWERTWDEELREYRLEPWVLLGVTAIRWEWVEGIEDAEVYFTDEAQPFRTIDTYDGDALVRQEIDGVDIPITKAKAS